MQFDVDGRSAYAYTGGRPFDAGRPVVAFVHGAQHDHSVWILQTRHLAHHGFSVLAFDLPGHGRSAGPALPDVESMAGWVLRALRAAGVTQPAALVGHSMGSLIALEAAGQAPQAIGGIAMVSTAFPMKVSDLLLNAAREDEPAAFDMINQWSHARLVHRPGTPGPGFSVYVQNLRLMERQAPGVLLNDFTACNAYSRGLERAAGLHCPALLVLGERDAMTPPRAAAGLIGAMPGANVVRVAGSGHAIMTEAPDALRDALDGWLRSAAFERAAAAT
jgi:pimeloyl-ACP methyl ester carboxylesterase